MLDYSILALPVILLAGAFVGVIASIVLLAAARMAARHKGKGGNE